MDKKRVAVIGTVGLPANYGGFETLVSNLTSYLKSDVDFTVFCSKKNYSEQLSEYNKAKLIYLSFDANGYQSVIYDIVSMIKSLKFADTLLILGVSGCIFLPFLKLFTKKKIIVNPDGIEWKRDKWKKHAKIFLKVSEVFAVKFADIIVSDNFHIQKYIKEQYERESVLIEYGADQVKKLKLSNDLLKKYPFLKENYALSVSRIVPENNIKTILKAFSQCESFPLVIVGNWENSNYGQNLKKEFSSFKNIYMIDSIYDLEILDQIRSNCYLYVHGHSAGGTNPSLIEAMYLGLPVVAYDIHYNVETTGGLAKYFKDEESLCEIVENITKEELDEISNKMSILANNKYKWSNISKKYLEIF
jgi:glycosyltransferase involved in cell wall biosynthesis